MKRILQVTSLAVALACVSGVMASARSSARSGKFVPVKMAADNTAIIYSQNCATCHGKDGRGKTIKGKLKHVPDLTGAEWQDKASDDHIYNVISNGHEKMPAFGKKLSADQIESLVDYVRRLKK